MAIVIPPTQLEIYLFWYFFGINFVYTVLLVLGSFAVYRRRKEIKIEDFTTILHSSTLPQITFILPVFNEEKNVMPCLSSIFNLSYRYKRIICINDGSTDKTMDVLTKELNLVKIPNFLTEGLGTAEILQVYRSKNYPDVIVIDKCHKGKYDCLNLGVNVCKDPYFIAVDADTFIDDKGFEAIIRPMLSYPETVAVGATVRIKNGCTLDFNRINTKKISFGLWPMFQGLEYLRSFLQRQGWNYLGGNFVIAGAFSIFPTELIKKLGGFVDSVAEDMEIIIRLHHQLRKKKKKYRIFYLSDPVAWTQGPSTYKALSKQRVNWQWGMLESLYCHKSMFLNPRYGFLGFFNFPFWVIGEALEPVFEALGYILLITAWFYGYLNTSFFLMLIAVSFGFMIVYSLVCLLIEELSYKKYVSIKAILMMLFMAAIENFGYRQMMIYWRLKGFIKFFKNFKHTQQESKKINK